MAKTTRVRKKKVSKKTSKKVAKVVEKKEPRTHLTQQDFFTSETLSRDLNSATLSMQVTEQKLQNLTQREENLKLTFELNEKSILKQKGLVELRHKEYKAVYAKHVAHINALKEKYELGPEEDVAYNDETLEIVRT